MPEKKDRFGRRIIRTSFANKVDDVLLRFQLNFHADEVNRMIAGARNRVRCAHDYDGLINLDERSADATNDERARASDRDRTEKPTMCTLYVIISIEIVHF